MDIPSLEPHETLRLHRADVRGCFARSGLTQRGTVSIPLIQDIDLFITDRRVIVRAELFLGLFGADYVAWFASGSAPAGADVLASASAGEQRVLGPSLDLVATTGRQSALRGSELHLQLFLSEAADALAFIPAELRR